MLLMGRTDFFLVWLQRALLFSGLNQLASGKHSGEEKLKNALKTIQRAVLLCPGKQTHLMVTLLTSYLKLNVD